MIFPIKLRVVKSFPRYERRKPGMMWKYEDGWWIILPDTSGDIGKPGHPGQISWRTGDRASDGGYWTVTGEAPNLTVTPSIDVLRFVKQGDKHVREGSYFHGFITNGEITSV